MSDADGALLMAAARGEPGDHPIDTSIMCAITRFGLRSPRFLPRAYREYQRVVRASQQSDVPRLLRSAFLVENPSTWYSFSIWDGSPEFSAAVPAHVEAARRSFSWLAMDPEEGPELWSTKWQLKSVTNNLSWDGFDLRPVLLSDGLRQAV